MGPEAARDRVLKTLGATLGWLAVAVMLALASDTGVRLAPSPPPAGAPAPLAADR